MYKIILKNENENIIIHNSLSLRDSPRLMEGKVVLGGGSIPSFSFSILPNNPGFHKIYPFITQVEVKDFDAEENEFEGRVLIVNPEMTKEGIVSKTVLCEGVMGYLCDSIQPYVAEKYWEGDTERSGLEEFIDTLLENHNNQVEDYKKIYRGEVSIHPFKGSDNVTKGLNYQTTLECLQSKLLDSFGGEIDVKRGLDGKLYLYYAEQFGEFVDESIELSKNMESISQELDPTKIVTRLIPLGAKIEVDGKKTDERLTIASVNEGCNYLVCEELERFYGVHYGTVEFSDVTDAENLKTKGWEWFETGNAVSQVNSISALELSLINKNYKKIALYNTYPFKNALLGINGEARVVKKSINVIDPTASTMTFGDKDILLSDLGVNLNKNYTELKNKLNSVMTNDGNVMAEKVQGIIDGIKAQLKIQSTVAQKQDARAILFEDLDPDSPLYGAMALGTQGLQISNKRTADGRDWEWSTAFTAKGGYADVIIAGLLSDKKGYNWWNLDTGEFCLAATTMVGDSTVASKQNVADVKDAAYLYADNAVDELDNSLTMQNVFNRLTNDGAIQGLFMKDGQLYINASYVLAGILTGITINNGNGTFSVDENGNVIANSLSSSNANITGGSFNVLNDAEDASVILLRATKDYQNMFNAYGIRCSNSGKESWLSCAMISFNGDTWSMTLSDGILNMHRKSDNEQLFRINAGEIRHVGNLTILGTKSRLANTENYGERLLYCYETPSPMFGDLGEGYLDETGQCYIFIDDIFSETIDTDCAYQVFLQPYGKGECYVTERNPSYFIVEGTANLSFGWEIKAIQMNYDTMRLEEYEEPEMEGDTVAETEAYLNQLVSEEDVVMETETYLESLVYQEESEVQE